MLKSPIKLSSSNRSVSDASIPAASTEHVPLPATDAVSKQLQFVAGDVDTTGDYIEYSEAHGASLNQPITVHGADVPAGLVANRTYYAIPLTETRLQFALQPDAAAIDLTDAGSGTDLIVMLRQFAKYVLLTNYGGYDMVVRPTNDDSYAISDTDVEALLPYLSHQPMILNVSGFLFIACRAIGTDSSLCVVPLENY